MVEQSLFSKYMGKLHITIDDKTLELDVKLKDKQKIMTLMSKFADTLSEESLEGLTNTYIDILQRTYPDVSREQFEAFLLHKFEDFMTELSIAFGWTTREDFEKKMKERVKKGILSAKGDKD